MLSSSDPDSFDSWRLLPELSVLLYSPDVDGNSGHSNMSSPWFMECLCSLDGKWSHTILSASLSVPSSRTASPHVASPLGVSLRFCWYEVKVTSGICPFEPLEVLPPVVAFPINVFSERIYVALGEGCIPFKRSSSNGVIG